MTKLAILQNALTHNQPIEFLDNRGSHYAGTVIRITWDDYEDICSFKDEKGKVTTLPINNMSMIVGGKR